MKVPAHTPGKNARLTGRPDEHRSVGDGQGYIISGSF
jgi:hypothetical protein